MPAVRNYNNVTSLGALTGPVLGAATTLVVTAFSQYPATPFTITVDRNTATEEIMLVTSVSGSTLTVTRGYDGTAGIGHLAGATVEHTAVALDFTEANQHHNATANIHGVTGDLVGAEGSQTILDKTFVGNVHMADATEGDAVVAVIAAGAGARNLFRGVGTDGADKAIVDAAGNATFAGHAVSGMDTRLTAAEATLSGATASPTVSTVVKRDAAGRTQVAAPAAANDAANKTYTDTGDTAARAYTDTRETAINARTDSFGRHRGSGTSYPASPVEGDTFRRTDLGYTARYDGTLWIPLGETAVYGKLWRSLGFSGAMTAGTDYAVVADTHRVAGGVTAVHDTSGTAFSNVFGNSLTIPLDGLYRLNVRPYATGGSPPYDMTFYAMRNRAATADAAIVTTVVYKPDAQDQMTSVQDVVPLKAGDKLALRANASVTGANYWGLGETTGVSLGVYFLGPLNGATPV